MEAATLLFGQLSTWALKINHGQDGFPVFFFEKIKTPGMETEHDRWPWN